MQSLAQAEGGANADEDSHEVVNVSSTDPAPTSDFDEYLNCLHSAAAESSTSPAATADINAFSDALTEVERLGRLRQPSVWAVADLGGGMGGCISLHQPKTNNFGRKISLHFEKSVSISGCIPPTSPNLTISAGDHLILGGKNV